MNEHIVGVDPGNRWTGVATLLVDATHISAIMLVLDSQAYSIKFLTDVIIHDQAKTVVAEEYRNRPIGHQRFNAPLTPRLLGALEYRAISVGATWAKIPAAPFDAVKAFPIWKRIEVWKEHCQAPTDHRWSHAFSAWRVLSAYVLRNKPRVHTAIERSRRSSLEYDELTAMRRSDLVAPVISWRLLA